MYQALLTRKYLTTKIMPLLAVVAVMLCSAMVLIVWSIMGGFLTMLLGSGRSLMGDVIISWPTGGFPHYERLVQKLEADPSVAAAAPIIETFGTIYLPDGRVEGVQIKGIDGPRYANVVHYAESLWWRPLDEPLPKDRRGPDEVVLKEGRVLRGQILSEDQSGVRIRVEQGPERGTRTIPADQIVDTWRGTYGDPRISSPNMDWQRTYDEGLRLRKRDPVTGEMRPAAVLGVEVTGFNKRMEEGYYVPGVFAVRSADGTLQWRNEFILNSRILVNVFPLGRSGRPADVVSRIVPVANESRSGVFEIDRNSVMLDLGELQRMLRMDEARRVDDAAYDPYGLSIDPVTGEERFDAPQTAEVEPARVTSVVVRAVKGVNPEQLRVKCREIYESFAAEFPNQVPAPLPRAPAGEPEIRFSPGSIVIQTWEDRQGTIVMAVKKEIAMVMFILLFISMTASIVILSMFWAMVSEKTKDIGILRSIGASRAGIAWLWLRYGLAIGLMGALLGGVAAHLIVWNVNPIHDWLGRSLGLFIWDPRVYYFTEIPHEVDPWNAAVVLLGALGFSVLGALIPAVRAAYMDPVRALRFE